MDFPEYLTHKKIDPKRFQLNEQIVYEEWEREFKEVHVDSFTMRKLNLINSIRRKYPLGEEKN